MSLQDEIAKQFKALFKGTLTAADRQLVIEVADVAAEMQIELLRGDMTPAQVKKEKAQLNAQLANLKSAGEGRAVATFWKAFNIAAGALTKLIVAA